VQIAARRFLEAAPLPLLAQDEDPSLWNARSHAEAARLTLTAHGIVYWGRGRATLLGVDITITRCHASRLEKFRLIFAFLGFNFHRHC
jgi:hypothetical protein